MKKALTVQVSKGPTGLLHILFQSEVALCGQRDHLETVDAMPSAEFDEWVTEDPGAHGWRRGLCASCRHALPNFVEWLRKR